MDVKEFIDKTAEDTQEILQKRLDELKEKVSTISDMKELEELEKGIDDEQTELDEYLKTAEYELDQKGVEFEGKVYKPADVARKITTLLNNIEEGFQYCLGLHGLYLTWKKTGLDKISYGAYDSTLRLLGGLRFKGDKEWCDILIINNYLTCAHEAYSKDRSMLIALAEMRNVIVNRMQLIAKPGEMPVTE